MLPSQRVKQGARHGAPARDVEADEAPGAGWAVLTKALRDAHELPEWYPSAPFIKRRYRVGYGACDCVASVFELHNESCNVWSHALGCAYFFNRSWSTAALLRFGDVSLRDDRTALLIFTASATVMLGTSAAYHTFHPVSQSAARRWLVADKIGIALMIAGSMVPGVWLGFRCADAVVRRLYLAAAFAVLGVGAALALDVVDERHHATAFASLVASAAAPATHWALITPVALVHEFLPKLGLMFALYGLGFAFYVSKWPERNAPGVYDLLGSSHQLWHVCVVLAALAWHSDVQDYLGFVHHDARFKCAAL
ncbi:hemolysin-III related-domain-containing protein [Pelagophyceae sp. CCMP2097]|nr:hemolysin-III related-domain-containing protein [Pelagophyceae sp. CCMP2097]|mmetsp:Transcript_16100/g.56278  ORF Transcript_16100/g.56278 Transcript_16100/m.56278 type:complete len:310 (+) Transcript_16100:170-1099(+)